jgi:hypothetical protein
VAAGNPAAAGEAVTIYARFPPLMAADIVPKLICVDASHLPASVVHRRSYPLGHLGGGRVPLERQGNIHRRV